MTDLPAPPPPSSPPPPPPAPYGGAPGFGTAPSKPPRPKRPVAGWLMVGGAIVAIVGCALNWFSVGDYDVNGFTKTLGENNDGAAFTFFAVVIIGLGIAIVAAGRVLACAIIGIVVSAFLCLGATSDISDVNDLKTFELVSVGPGLYVVLLGGLVSLAGSIWITSIRRR